MGELANLATDIVSGCACCAASAASRSSTTATAASPRRSAAPASGRPAAVAARGAPGLLPGIFVVVVVWLGAPLAVERQDHPGRAGRVLRLRRVPVIPLRTATEYANKLIRGLRGRPSGSAPCSRSSPIVDPASRRRAPIGCGAGRRPTGLGSSPACSPRSSPSGPTRARRSRDRLGRYAEGDDDVPSGRVAERPRPRGGPPPHVVCDTGRTLFTGVLRRELDVAGPSEAVDAPCHRVAPRTPRRPAGPLDAEVDRARPQLLRRPAAAAGAGPRAPGGPRGPGARRADLRGRRPHRGPDRGPAARAPRRPHHGRGDQQPADPRRRRRGGVPARRPGGRHRHHADLLDRDPAYRARGHARGEEDAHEHLPPDRRRPRRPPVRRRPARRHRGGVGRVALHVSPRSPGWPRPGCLATSSRRSRAVRPSARSTGS